MTDQNMQSRENRWPTPREFVDDWERATDAQRLARAERIIADMQAASQCFVMAHDDLQREAQWLRDQKFTVQVEMDKARAKVARVEALCDDMDERGRPGANDSAHDSASRRQIREDVKRLRAALDGDA